MKRVLGKRGHCDLNIRGVLIGAVVMSRADAHQQTALYRNHLKALPGAAWCAAQGVCIVMPERYG